MFRCSHDGGASGRLLELHIWMFNRAACTLMRVETFPQADIAALQALRALIDATAIGDVGHASSNAPVSGAARASHDQNWGEVHATPRGAPGTSCSATRTTTPCWEGPATTPSGWPGQRPCQRQRGQRPPVGPRRRRHARRRQRRQQPRGRARSPTADLAGPSRRYRYAPLSAATFPQAARHGFFVAACLTLFGPPVNAVPA